MKKKLLFILLIVGLLLTSCGKKQEPVNNEPIEISEDYLGYFYEKEAGRAVLSIKNPRDDGSADVVIDWGSSASETAHWEMLVKFDPKANMFSYKDGLHTVRTYDTAGNYEEKEVYKNGSGSFTVDGFDLIWHSDKDDQGGDVVFSREVERKDDTAGMINPWIETTDLNVAIKNAGVEFDPPLVETLPTGKNKVMPFKFLSTFGTLCAYYESVDNEMIIKKSTENQGKEGLAGDYNTYSKTWTNRYKDIELNLAGDGKLANVVWFDLDGDHYSITFNSGQESKGLSLEEITSMIDGMDYGDPVK